MHVLALLYFALMAIASFGFSRFFNNEATEVFFEDIQFSRTVRMILLMLLSFGFLLIGFLNVVAFLVFL